MTYDQSVFINCPFDSDYQRLFRALVFVIQDCGFTPRCALEVDDGSEARIGKLQRIIEESRYGVHDISRTELDDESGLPRFNMPLELGIFLGAKYFGEARQRAKACIILDRDPYRYQRFCSDIAGLDVRPHRCDESDLIRGVRDALRTWRPDQAIPSGRTLFVRYLAFAEAIPGMAVKLKLDVEEITFRDLTGLVSLWLEMNGGGGPAGSRDGWAPG